VKPIKIQVVALQWKWLFIYPEHNIASLNFFQFPEQTPLEFAITADAPMNSFWISQLGGQIYAMPGMNSKLHLIANETGEFRGSSANLSGEGFAGMHFIAKSSTHADFDQWVESVKSSSNTLDKESYRKLALPSKNNPPEIYVLKDIHLYNQIIMRYMMPPETTKTDIEPPKQQIGKQ
jgi:cytochrome o ubiquinol oxidase subunit 2